MELLSQNSTCVVSLYTINAGGFDNGPFTVT